MNRKEHYMELLESRTKRLNKLIEVLAPEEMICNEVLLVMQAAVAINPTPFKNWKKK